MLTYTNLIIFNILIAYLFTKQPKNSVKVLLFLMMVLSTSLIAGLRAPNVGTDTQAYIEGFYNINSTKGGLSSYRMEPLFILLNKVAYFIYPHHFTMLFLSSLITVSLFFYVYSKYSTNFILSILLFYPYIYYASFNGVRQYIAVAITFYR